MKALWVAVVLASCLCGGRASASAPLGVVFGESARELPQAEIRAAIAAELERETLAEAEQDGVTDWVAVALDGEGQLLVRYRGPRGLVERRLPLPERRDELALVVSLAVGNLVRQEASDVLRDLERQRLAREQAEQAERERLAEQAAQRRQPAPPVKAPPPQAKPEHRNVIGSFGAVEFGSFPSTQGVCTPYRSVRQVRCYTQQNRFEPYSYTPPSEELAAAGVTPGVGFAGYRFGLFYMRRFSRHVAAGLRVAIDLTRQPDDYVPWQAEARYQYWTGSWFDGAVQAYFPLGFGAAEFYPRAPVRVGIYDEQSAPTEQPTDYVSASAVYPQGWAYVSLGAGLALHLTERVRFELELGLALTAPTVGMVYRPLIFGGSVDF